MRLGGGIALAIVAFSAASACTVDQATSGLGVGSATTTSTGTSSGGRGGSSAGGAGGSAGSTTTSSTTAGSSGAGGSATDGSAGSDNTDGSAGGGATTDVSDGGLSDRGSGACFAEDGDDAGTAPPCSALPYFAQSCADDAGDRAPLGARICSALELDTKIAAARELFDCLKATPGADGGDEACSPAHDAAAADCSIKIFSGSTCSVPDGDGVDGGAYGCAQIAASCPPDAGAGGITIAQCQAWLNPFNAAARQDIIDCYLDPNIPSGTSCADKFENQCVFP
jgi:hypothetical protein